MKHSVYQVVDELPRVRSTAEIAALIRSRPELKWAALLDTIFDHDSRRLDLGSPGLNCYDFPELQALGAVAPHLIGIAPDDTMETQISRLITHCQGRPMLSFIGTARSLEDVIEAWRAVHMVSVVDEQKMLLRFADTRVLAYLPAILQASQWERMCGAVGCWAYFDRCGNLAILDIPGCETSGADIQIDREQLGALLEASQPDALMALIADQMFDIVPWKQVASERYTMVNDACKLAKRFAIDDHADVLALAVAAYLSEGASNSNPHLNALLGQRAWPSGSLGSAVVDAEIV